MPIDLGHWMRIFLMFGPALGLAVLGVTLALRSGNATLGTELGARSLASNASQLVVRLSLWLAGIAAVGEILGLRALML